MYYVCRKLYFEELLLKPASYIYKNRELFLVFVVAFLIRLLFWVLFGTYLNITNSDSLEYYINSINFQPLDVHKAYWGYDNWYERTPLYILFLHITHRELIIQVFLSALSCVLMFKLNKTAGILWIFYPQEIIYSFQYGKETLLIFLVIMFIYLLRNHRIYLLLAIPLIILGFVSYGGVIHTNNSLSKGLMQNFWNLWKPAFNVSLIYSKAFVYIQFLPYAAAMLYFIRKVKLASIEFGIFTMLTVVYCIIYSEPRYREPFMPFLFLYIAEPLRIYIIKFKEKNMKAYFFDKYAELKNKIAMPEYARDLKPASIAFILIVYKSLIAKL